MAAPPARAERRYAASAQLDLNGGATNSISGSHQGGSYTGQELSGYYSASPSVDLATEGQNFNLGAGYGFTWSHYEQDDPVDTQSHTVRFRLMSNLSRNLRLTLTNRFNSTPDYITYELSRNLIIGDDGFGYAYTPVPSRQSFQNDHARLGLDWDLGPESSLSLSVGGGYRDYGEDPGGSPEVLYDQVRYEGSLGYHRRRSARTGWIARYAVSRNQYESYGTSLAHSALGGISYQWRPTVEIAFEAGPTRVASSRSGKGYWGYTGNFRMTKSMERTQASLFASHRSGDSSGVGYVSDTERGGIGFSFQPLRRLNVAFNSSAYRSRQRHDSPLTVWGVDGGAQISWLLSRYLRLGGGASYRRIEGHQALDREYKQFYGSINLLAPDFWNIQR